MHIELLVEEPSMEAALENLLPRLLPAEFTHRIITFQGKQNLLRQLPARMRGYAAWITQQYRIIVLVDEDREDCLRLKQQMEASARQVGLSTKTSAGGARFQVLNRIVIEELEAWFFGDIEAIHHAYPNIPLTLQDNQKFRDPDSIAGGTWETLERTMQRYGYFRGGYAKREAASAISVHMEPDRNRSRSFQVFHEGLLALT